MAKVLIVGESWSSSAFHVKGFDFFHSATYHTGHLQFKQALLEAGHQVHHLPAHQAAAEFPLELRDLQAYDVLILSDIGANTLLLHPDTWLHGKRVPNRLRLIEAFVLAGGGLMMAGGYLSFQGFGGAARYRGSPVEAVLPVTLLPYDDRIEEPEGLTSRVLAPDHPLAQGLDGDWPPLLGLNELSPKEGATCVAEAGGYPLLVCGEFGAGRAVAWASDIGPHWCPPEFLAWPGYARLWANVVRYLTRA